MRREISKGGSHGLRIVLVGNGPLFRAVARGVLAGGDHLVGVVTSGQEPVAGNPPLAHGGVNRERVLRRLRALVPDLILVGSWPEKLGPELLALPRLGCVNCHPSLLPAHRGTNPYLSAIVAGQDLTGVTFHQMTDCWDSGEILLQREVGIERSDTGGSLRERCAGVAAVMVPELLDSLADGSSQPRAQDEMCASYFPLPAHHDLEIDWPLPARRIHDWIRGVRPWQRCYSYMGGRRVFFDHGEVVPGGRGNVRPGEVLAVNAKCLVVATGDKESAVAVEKGRFGRPAWPWWPTSIRVGMRFRMGR